MSDFSSSPSFSDSDEMDSISSTQTSVDMALQQAQEDFPGVEETDPNEVNSEPFPAYDDSEFVFEEPAAEVLPYDEEDIARALARFGPVMSGSLRDRSIRISRSASRRKSASSRPGVPSDWTSGTDSDFQPKKAYDATPYAPPTKRHKKNRSKAKAKSKTPNTSRPLETVDIRRAPRPFKMPYPSSGTMTLALILSFAIFFSTFWVLDALFY